MGLHTYKKRELRQLMSVSPSLVCPLFLADAVCTFDPRQALLPIPVPRITTLETSMLEQVRSQHATR